MQCDHCDNKATVFYTQIIDGISKKSCLCESCATKQGVTDPEGFLLGSEDNAPGGKPPKPLVVPQPEMSAGKQPARCCPGCGFAFDDLKKTGRLGCSQCYEFFRREIKANLGGMHKGTCHAGRVPEGMLEAFAQRQRMEKLQLDLNDAIESEDYEKAASLRDQINQITGESPESEQAPSEP